jgi:predicted  nucleic acid-binding Zn-ribbon protein
MSEEECNNLEVTPMTVNQRLERLSRYGKTNERKEREFDPSVSLDALHRYLYELKRNAESIEYNLRFLKENCSGDSYKFFLEKFKLSQSRRDAISIIAKNWM